MIVGRARVLSRVQRRRAQRSAALVVLLCAHCGVELELPPASSNLGGSCAEIRDCGAGGFCAGASACRSGICTQPCDSVGQCPQDYRCSLFASVNQDGTPARRGYCLRACTSNSECESALCDRDLQVCVTASLRYDVGSPVIADDDNCISLHTLPGSNPFNAPVLLTEPGEVFLFGPTVALDPTDSSVRYVAYNSVEGTNVSVSHNGGVNWSRIPMMPRIDAANIGDPGLGINSTTREVWHSFLTAPEVTCVHDQTTHSDNAIAVTSSNGPRTNMATGDKGRCGALRPRLFRRSPVHCSW